VVLALLLGVAILPRGSAQTEWPQFGQNNANTSNNDVESHISVETAPTLKMKWKFSANGDVSARAAVVGGVAYFPDWDGWLWALNATSGKVIWGKKLTSYGLANPSTGKALTTAVSRATPAVANNVLYLGVLQGGWFLAVNAKNGNLIWKVRPETTDNSAQITGSASYAAGIVYVGVTSSEESLVGDKPRTARGSVVALEASSGKEQWKTYMTITGYDGAGVWGSSPVVDEHRSSVFVGTGDNYDDPTNAAYTQCIQKGGKPSACQSSQNYVDSVVAMDMYTGKVKWGRKLVTWPEDQSQSGSDMFNLSCVHTGDAGCPTPEGPDYDFGSDPNEITYAVSGGSETILGIGQKSGIYYALNPDTGSVIWKTQVGPGSRMGGILWGSAADSKRIYVAIGNPFGASYPNKALGTAGTWAALDVATGKILWQVADPSGVPDLGAMTVADGVVYAPSTAHASGAPTMLALNASTGKRIWSYAGGATTIAGATVLNGIVYWGSGYSRLGSPYTGNHMLYAFSLNGK
jgi:polyvinyl alcohol dehydrogenase (cytochrome)